MNDTVYMLSGTMCTDAIWQLVTPHLTTQVNWQLVALPNESSFEQMTRALSEQLPEKNITLVGFSLGGYLAAHFAKTYANKCRKLCIISNSPCQLNSEELTLRKQALAWLDKFNYQGISSTKARQLLDEKISNQDELNKLINIIQDMDNQLGEDTLKKQLRATTHREDLSRTLNALKGTGHFIYSANDPLVNTLWLDNLFANSPHLTRKIYSGSSHMLPLQRPKELAKQLNSWVLGNRLEQ